MKNKHLQKGLIFSFLLTFMLSSPLQVLAAEEAITKELTITAKNEQDYKKQAEEAFAMEIEEGGQKYERTEIRYEITETEYLDKKEKVVETAEPEETIMEGKLEYTLIDFKEPEKIEQTVTAYDDYDHLVTEADVPATKEVTATNDVTGEQEVVTCTLTGVSPAGTTTVDNVMTITFSNYDSAYYEWNGNYIAHNDQTPPLAGYEDQLLAQAGAAAGSVITGYSYSGEPYTVDGIVYRDATATVRQQVPLYRAYYEGFLTAQDPDASGTATYSGPDPDGRVELTVKAVASYIPITSYMPYIVTAAGIFLLLLLIVLIIYLFTKKKKEKGAINSTK